MDRYYTYKRYLLQRYGHPVYRVGVDAGFTCPHRDDSRRGGCIYCDSFGAAAAYQRGSNGNPEDIPLSMRSLEQRLEAVSRQIDTGIAFLRQRYNPGGFALYLQAFSNTFAPLEELEQIYSHALGRYPFTEFILSTRPDCIDEATADLLMQYRSQVSDLWVELGLQSASSSTLEFIRRGHTAAAVTNACNLLRSRGIKISLHTILGLPGEGADHRRETAEFITREHPEALKIHNLHIPIETELQAMYVSGEAVTASAERHVEQTAQLLSAVPGDIVIQRIVCDTPTHRLSAPKGFAPKGQVIQMLSKYLQEHDLWQGKSLGYTRENGRGKNQAYEYLR